MSSVLWSYWLVSLSSRHSARAQLTQAWPQAHRQRVQPTRGIRAEPLGCAFPCGFCILGVSWIFELNLGLGCKSSQTKMTQPTPGSFPVRPCTTPQFKVPPSYSLLPAGLPFAIQPCIPDGALPLISCRQYGTSGKARRCFLQPAQRHWN